MARVTIAVRPGGTGFQQGAKTANLRILQEQS